MQHEAFLSYSHLNDIPAEGESKGPITALREALERLLTDHLGRPATIFQDIAGLRFGTRWEPELRSALNCPCLIPIVTPAYFESRNCVTELLEFASFETGKHHEDRILPLYYIEVPQLEKQYGRPVDACPEYTADQSRALEILVQRHIADIRSFRGLPPRDLLQQPARDLLEKLARQIAARYMQASAGRRKAPTLVVASNSRFRSISAAIQEAEPGARIVVKGPSEFHEALKIDKPLEIIAENQGVTVIGTGGAGITCLAAPVRVANLNIRAEKGFNGAIVSGGYIVFEGCDVGHTSYSCVLVKDGAEAALLMCSLHHAEHCGIHTEFGSKSVVVNSVIQDNRIGGLFFSTNAEGLAEGNLIERNGVAGVFISAGANPRVRRNQIRYNGRCGILVYLHDQQWPEYGAGRGIIETNEISHSEQFGIEIKQGANPCVRSNTISLNKYGGIWTWDGGCGTIYDNRIVNNIGSGIKNVGGRPRIGKNLFSGNGGQPVEDQGGAIQDDTAACPDLEHGPVGVSNE